MSNVVKGDFPLNLPRTPNKGDVEINNGGNGGDGMDTRIAKLESEVSKIKENLNDIKTDIAVIKSNYAKKEDVVSSANKIILWVAGVVVFAQLLPALPKIIDTFIK